MATHHQEGNAQLSTDEILLQEHVSSNNCGWNQRRCMQLVVDATGRRMTISCYCASKQSVTSSHKPSSIYPPVSPTVPLSEAECCLRQVASTLPPVGVCHIRSTATVKLDMSPRLTEQTEPCPHGWKGQSKGENCRNLAEILSASRAFSFSLSFFSGIYKVLY